MASPYFLCVYGHLLRVGLVNHHIILHPLEGWEGKAPDLSWDVHDGTLLHSDGVALEVLHNANDRRN